MIKKIAFVSFGSTDMDADKRFFGELLGLTPTTMKRGECKINLQRFAAALADYERVLTLDPENACAHARRGECKQGLGRYAEALGHYRRAFELGLDPSHSERVRQLGAAAAELAR